MSDSIQDDNSAKPQLTHGSLFSGIGGFDLGFERAGIKTVFQVEIDPFCRKVLEKHWPYVRRFDDIRKILPGELPRVDIISAGVPCQPTSSAGKRKGEDDPRFLWPEVLRNVAAHQPIWFVAENPIGILSPKFRRIVHEIYASLEREGYSAISISVPASAFGAWHERQRLFIIANLDGKGCERTRIHPRSRRQAKAQAVSGGQGPPDADTTSARSLSATQTGIHSGQESIGSRNEEPKRRDWWAVEPDVVRMVHGIPARMDRIAALGNAVVPQIAEWIGRRILEAEKERLTHERR